MEKLKIYLMCAAAMSSAFMVEKMKESAKEKGIDVEIDCHPQVRYRNFDYTDVSYVLLAPQVKASKVDVEKYIREKGLNVPVGVIPMQDYGLMRGDKVLQVVLDEMNYMIN